MRMGVLLVSAWFLLMLHLATCASVNSTVWTFSGQSYLEVWPQYSDSQNHHLQLTFRTSDPNGLLFHHHLSDYNKQEFPFLTHYEFIGEIRLGHIKVSYLLNQYSDTVVIGSALNNDKWHLLDVVLNVQLGELVVSINKEVSQVRMLDSFKRGNARTILRWSELPSVIMFGGLKPTESHNFHNFVGCLGDIKYDSEDGNFVNVPFQDEVEVTAGCTDMCMKGDNCENHGHCINKYTHTKCDCFGTDYEGDMCQVKGPTVMTFRGYEWVTYKLYNKAEDLIYSDNTRISFEFKTDRGSGVLLYAVGGAALHSHVTISLHAGELRVSVSLGYNDLEFRIGMGLDDNLWHNITIAHDKHTINVIMDMEQHSQMSNGSQYFLILDPRIYFGGGHNFVETRGLHVTQSFVGCLRNVYFNEVSVLFELSQSNAQCDYHGGLAPLFTCQTLKEIPFSFPKSSSMLRWVTKRQQDLNIQLKFRTIRMDAILFYVQLISWKSEGGGYDFGYLEVWLKEGHPSLHFVPSRNVTFTQMLTIPAFVSNSRWHSMKLTLKNSEVKLKIDQISTNTTRYMKMIEQRGTLVFGYGFRNYKVHDGFVGCMKDIKIQGKKVDPVATIETASAMGLKLDGCHLVDHCTTKNICEHGGTCLSDWSGVHCDCPQHYEGKACHFSKHLRTCDSYFQVGRNVSGIFVIDVDGSGPLDPVYVYCNMTQEHNNHRFGDTVINHNFHPNTTIRQVGFANRRYHITYQGMTRDHLRALTSYSASCEQKVQYDCLQSALNLGEKTWFQAANGEIVDYIGPQQSGYCNCPNGDMCDGKRCFCDHESLEWRRDLGRNTVKKQLPLLDITVLQHTHGEARLTLGPLKCWGSMYQPLDRTVTLTQEQSFIKLYAWQMGEMNFNFKTYQSHSLVMYQSPTKENHNMMMITIESAHTIKILFFLKSHSIEAVLNSVKPLDNGDWHSVVIKHDMYNIHLSLDESYKIVDLPDDVTNVTNFAGIIYLGGVPEEVKDHIVSTSGFVGCLRGFHYNSAFKDLTGEIDESMTGLNTGCMSSCWPNPCANGGVCLEEWGTYTCQCSDKWSHHGINCEVDINLDAVTLGGKNNSFLFFDMTDRSEILDRTIILSFRTFQEEALLLYIHDQLNNFVQMELVDSRSIAISYNTFDQIIRELVTVDGILNDGKWKQIVAEDFFNLTKLQIEGVERVINFRRVKLVDYSAHPFTGSRQQETVLFRARPSMEPRHFVHVYAGGVPKGGAAVASLKGCIRGLKIGTIVMQLAEAANNKGNNSEVTPACKTGCQENTCLHGGFCYEYWKYGDYKCDCTESDYSGVQCEIEPSVVLTGSSYVQYSFNLGPTSSHSRTEEVAFSFKTTGTDRRDADGNLMDMLLVLVRSSTTKDYVLAKVEQSGSIILETSQGFGKYILRVTGDYANGVFHDFHYKREASDMYLTIDGEKKAKYNFPDYSLDEIDNIFVGGSPPADDYSLEVTNFTGCMSKVVYSPMANTPLRAKIRPLKELYVKNKTVKVLGLNVTSCQTQKPHDFGSTVAPVSKKTTTQHYEKLTMPPWNPGPAKLRIIGSVPILSTVLPTTTTSYIIITNLTLTVIKNGVADELTVAVAVSVIAALLMVAVIVALLLCRKGKRQGDYYLKKDADFEMKEPLQLNHYEASPVPFDHLAKLDEFSMISATLGPRPSNKVEPSDPPNRFSQASFPLIVEEPLYPNVIYNQRKKRPASSISEVLEEMERRQKGHLSDDPSEPSSHNEFAARNHGEGELEWDPIADKTPLTVGNITFFNTPLLAKTPEEPENEDEILPSSDHLEADKVTDTDQPNSATEYNGDSGYEAESRPENTEEDVTPISTVDDDLPDKMYMYDLTSLEDNSNDLSSPIRHLLADHERESFL
ncbi:contactin-associated protein-like 2 [Gigantopelta aegis]|uniref:contactin-associated protein-like 2 n=1 Tax=Gigantopelta aegis TaxID=1735272 RepID=UPI001B88C2AF|nr:contactin-associated protein-like 2 [Gigantopelta aegis]